MLLTGTYARSLDEKLRVAVPKRLREVIAPDDKASIFVAPGTDGTLTIYGGEAFLRLAEKHQQLSPTRQEVRTYSRLFFARAQQVQLDVQGRMRIPPELANWASLTKDVVLLGVQDHVEVWAADRWQTYLTENEGHYDQIAEAAFRNVASPHAHKLD